MPSAANPPPSFQRALHRGYKSFDRTLKWTLGIAVVRPGFTLAGNAGTV
jgi:hypothetical protein